MEKNYDRTELLKYPDSEAKAVDLRKKWTKFILEENASHIHSDDIHIVAGVDLTYLNDGPTEYGMACAVLWDVDAKKEIAHEFAIEKVEFPYISGLLAFREIRIASLAIENLPRIPDLIMFDAHGRAHPFRFGAAVAIGLTLDMPSIGVAKRPLVGLWNWKNIRRRSGEKLPIIDNGEIVGYAIVLIDKHPPVFVSAGYKMDLDTSVEIALKTTFKFKQPECIGRAHEYLQNKKFTLLDTYKSRCK